VALLLGVKGGKADSWSLSFTSFTMSCREIIIEWILHTGKRDYTGYHIE
jgi:hypothetical protein